MWKWTGVSVLSSEILKERTAGNFVFRWPDAGQEIAGECNVFRILKIKMEITNMLIKMRSVRFKTTIKRFYG